MCKMHIKELFVSDLKLDNMVGQEIQEVFFLRNIAKYCVERLRFEVTLVDCSGSVTGKIWEDNMREYHESLKEGLVVVKGKIRIYKGTPEISLTSMEPIDKSNYTYNPTDFITSCIDDPEGFYNAFIIQYHKDIIKPHLIKLLDIGYKNKDCAIRFKDLQGAKLIHHAEVGGYMLHVTSVYNLCKEIAKTYQLHPCFDMDILLTAAALQDIGIIKEFRPFPYNQKTDEGYLLGHLALSFAMVYKMIGDIEDFPKEDATKLLHCIITSHGDHDKVVKPATVEAIILQRADEMDARIDSFNTLIVNDTEVGSKTKYSKVYDQYLYKF